MDQSKIQVLSIIPANNGFIADTGAIQACLQYHVAEDRVSSYGYSIMIELEPADGNGFTVTSTEILYVTKANDTIVFRYPLSNVKEFTGLKYPLTCRFWLERQTGDGINGFIANTGEYAFYYNR